MRDAAYIGDRAERGQAAAVALAGRLGLPAQRQEVLSSRGNLLLRLSGPAGSPSVVARVATLSAWSRRDPSAWLAREVAVAGYVSRRAGLAAAPARAADPGPHWQDGFAISLWEYLPASGRRPDPARTGTALAALHRAARDCPAELGYLSTLREHVTEGIDTLATHSVCDAETVAALGQAQADALAEIDAIASDRAGSATIVLHGDAHAGNLVVSGGRCTWIDLEETCRGPAEWDLACLITPYQDARDRQAALAAYAAEAEMPVPGMNVLDCFLRARELEGAVWTLCMAHLFPGRYRTTADELLARVLGRRQRGVF